MLEALTLDIHTPSCPPLQEGDAPNLQPSDRINLSLIYDCRQSPLSREGTMGV